MWVSAEMRTVVFPGPQEVGALGFFSSVEHPASRFSSFKSHARVRDIWRCPCSEADPKAAQVSGNNVCFFSWPQLCFHLVSFWGKSVVNQPLGTQGVTG